MGSVPWQRQHLSCLCYRITYGGGSCQEHRVITSSWLTVPQRIDDPQVVKLHMEMERCLYMDIVCDWVIKCVIYFIPVFLMWARYHSFLLECKKKAIDVIVDGQFCIIPFCLNLETIFHLWNKKPYSKENLFLILLLTFALALAYLVLYWDISFIRIQKEDNNPNNSEEKYATALEKNKERLLRYIIILLVLTLSISFYVDVIL